MRRRAVSSLISRLASAADDLGVTTLRQQGALAPAAPAAAAAAAPCGIRAGRAVSTQAGPAAGLAPAAAARLSPLQQPLLHHLQLQQHPFRGLSTAAEEGAEDLEPSLHGGVAGAVPQFSSAAQAADFVRERLHMGLTAEELGAVIRQMVQLHFEQIKKRGPRGETAGPMAEVLGLGLGEGSPLHSQGPAVSVLLWGAAKLRMRGPDVDRQALLEAAGRALDSCSASDLAAMLWALGWLRVEPSPEFWDRMGERLFGEGLASYLKVSDLVPALAGMTSLRRPDESAQAVAEYLMQELNKKCHTLRPREVGGICNFLPNAAPSPTRDELAEKVFNAAANAAPHMELVPLSSVLWAAAKLGQQLPDDTVAALLDRAQAQLGTNRGHAVPAMLWSLAKLGHRAGDDVVSEEFVRACIDSQMCTIEFRVHPQKITKFLNACGMLRVAPTEAEVQACFDSIQEQNYFLMDEHGLRSLMRAFQGFRFWPGVEACRERLGIEHVPRQPRRQWGSQSESWRERDGEAAGQQGEQGAEGPAGTEQEAEGERPAPAAAGL